MNRLSLTIGILFLCLNACAPTDQKPINRNGLNPYEQSRDVRDPSQPRREHGVGGAPVAFINGEAVGWAELLDPLNEVAGGRVLAELTLDRLLQEELTRRGLTVEEGSIQREEQALLQALNDDGEVAVRLLAGLRRERGLGRQRYRAMLGRNAAMRLLVQDQVQVTPEAVRSEYKRRHGERYTVRLILAESLNGAEQLVARARGGESFADLAIAHSLDASAAQGGLLPTISTADESYPTAIRASLPGMQPGQVSNPILLDNGFAILQLERVMDRDAVAMDDVYDSLANVVRERITRQYMRRLARSTLAKADVVVLNPTLKQGWDQQRAGAFEAAP